MKWITILLMLVFIPSAHALIIQGIESDQDAYANGELIEITLYANERDLEITADFSKVDSNYQEEMVMTEEIQDFVYKIWYPITFSNNKGAGLHNTVISAFSRKSDTSTIASYAIELDNAVRINRTVDSDRIKLRVRSTRDDPDEQPTSSSSITVEDGYIKVCRPNGCDTLTESEYEAARRVVISSGSVELHYSILKNLS
jgi:hypothetical protein